MSDREKYYAGTAIRIDVDVKDYASSYMDPDTSLVISVEDPAGATRVDGASLEKDAVGQYHYNCQTAEDWPKGRYLVTCRAVDDTYTALVKPYLFRLK